MIYLQHYRSNKLVWLQRAHSEVVKLSPWDSIDLKKMSPMFHFWSPNILFNSLNVNYLNQFHINYLNQLQC